jgi:hypothetical protein
MLALYLPILLYSFSTFDISEEAVAIKEVNPTLVGQKSLVLGQQYSAKALMIPPSDKIGVEARDERMRVQGDSLVMDTGDLLAEGEDEATINYEAAMNVSTVDKSTRTITTQGRFTVRRPEIVATSVATQSLYRQTLNQIRIDVPGLENRPLRLETSSGSSVDGRQIQLSPGGNNVTVSAYLASGSKDVYLGEKQFNVISPPLPQVKVLDAQGSELTTGDPIPQARPLINIEFEPDQEYASTYPDDANYRVSEARVSLRRGKTASEELGTFPVGSGGQLNLAGKLPRDVQSGDQIIVSLQGIARVNHAGTTIPLDLAQSSRQFSFRLQ